MAYPFGNHPSLARYMKHATDMGLEVNTYPSGAVIITNPANHRWYIFAPMPQTEFLTPSEVARADRRLGWDSGFSKLEVAG